jgi:hypothetical protein
VAGRVEDGLSLCRRRREGAGRGEPVVLHKPTVQEATGAGRNDTTVVAVVMTIPLDRVAARTKSPDQSLASRPTGGCSLSVMGVKSVTVVKVPLTTPRRHLQWGRRSFRILTIQQNRFGSRPARNAGSIDSPPSHGLQNYVFRRDQKVHNGEEDEDLL